MKAKLSYLYIGERFPELSGTEVVVKEIAELANLSYVLLKNRMGIKKRRNEGLSSVWIADSDLAPKKKEYPNREKRRPLCKEEEIQRFNNKYLKRKWL